MADPMRALTGETTRERVARKRRTLDVAIEVTAERERQHAKWGEQSHPDGTGGLGWEQDATEAREACQRAFAGGYGTWLDILAEEVAEAFAESDPSRLRAELIQIAAVCVQWAEAIDRRARGGP